MTLRPQKGLPKALLVGASPPDPPTFLSHSYVPSFRGTALPQARLGPRRASAQPTLGRSAGPLPEHIIPVDSGRCRAGPVRLVRVSPGHRAHCQAQSRCSGNALNVQVPCARPRGQKGGRVPLRQGAARGGDGRSLGCPGTLPLGSRPLSPAPSRPSPLSPAVHPGTQCPP